MEIIYFNVQMVRNGYYQMLNHIVYFAEQWPNGLEQNAGQNKNTNHNTATNILDIVNIGT